MYVYINTCLGVTQNHSATGLNHFALGNIALPHRVAFQIDDCVSAPLQILLQFF